MARKFSMYVMMALCILVLSACGSTSSSGTETNPDPASQGTRQAEQPAEEPSLVDLAKEEGKVVYFGASSLQELEPAFKLFTEKYGIEVEYVQLRGSEIVQKLLTESRAGKSTADLMSGGPTPVWELKKEGMFMEHLPAGSDNVLGTDPDGFYVGQTLNVYGIMVNTNLVQESDMPKSWQDLLDPKWKGKIIGDDPGAAGGGNSVFTILYEDQRFGEAYLKQLAEQEIVFTRQRDENANAVARGEYSIYIPSTSYTMIRMKDAPVTWIAPEDLTPYLYISRGILKDAPHPNAAKLFSEFMVTPEAQNAIVQLTTPALTGIEPPLESLRVSTDTMVTQTEKQLEEQNKYYDIFSKIFQ